MVCKRRRPRGRAEIAFQVTRRSVEELSMVLTLVFILTSRPTLSDTEQDRY